MTITVNICGLDSIAEGIQNLARTLGASGVSAAWRPNHGEGACALQQAAPGETSRPAAFTNRISGVAAPYPADVPASPVQQQAFSGNSVGQQAPAANQTTSPVSQTGILPVSSALPGQIPTTAVSPKYTQDQMAVAMTGLVDQGKQPQVMQILSQFGAASLMQVPKEQYGALATQLRALGANL